MLSHTGYAIWAAPPEQGTNTFPLKQDQEGIAQRPRCGWDGFSCVGPVRHSSQDTEHLQDVAAISQSSLQRLSSVV